MRKGISAQDASRLMLERAAPVGTETCPLQEAYGRILAEEISARIAVPPFDRSPYDGYAFRAEDTASATRDNPAVLTITEELPAGTAPTLPVTAGRAAKILTGAPVPEGADTIIKYEETEFDSRTVRIFAPQKPGDIVPRGEDIMPGELIARCGDEITAPLMGVLAGQGIGSVTVYRRPRVTIINTGSELTEVGQPLRPAGIYNSNVYTLTGYLKRQGIDAVNGGICPDEPELIARAIGRALEEHDMVITTGGASVGDYDWAVRSAELLGSEILFWKLDFKPGGSMLAAECGGKMILSLSGNPGAALIGLFAVALPYLRRLCGRRETASQELTLVLRQGYPKSSPKERFVRGRVVIDGGTAFFEDSDKQGNGVISSFIDCDVVGVIPKGSGPMDAGEAIKAYRL